MRFDDGDARRLIVRLAAAVMMADGRITTAEREVLQRLDRLGLGSLSALADEEIARAMREPVDISAACSGLVAVGPQAAAVIVAALAAIAVSDQSLPPGEIETLGAIATHLGLVPEETAAIVTAALDAYAPRLGVHAGAQRDRWPATSGPLCTPLSPASLPPVRTRCARPLRVPRSTQWCVMRFAPRRRHGAMIRPSHALPARNR